MKVVHTRLVPRPLEMMSNNPAQIHVWGQAEPGANVCVYAKQAEGELLFLDKDGAISLREKYERETGKQFPKTLLVRSSIVDMSGVRVEKGHWYFRQTPKTIALDGNISEDSNGGLFSLRVHNQYVASIGSIHPKTGLPYAVAEENPVVAMPDDLLAWLQAQVVQKPKTRKEVIERGKFGKGTRYPALISEAGRLWQRGYSAEDVIDTATKWAKENFDIPEGAFNESLVRAEVKRIVDTYPQGNPAGETVVVNGNTIGTAQTAPAQAADAQAEQTPIVDDPSDHDSRFEITPPYRLRRRHSQVSLWKSERLNHEERPSSAERTEPMLMNIRDRANNQKCDEVRIHRSSRSNFLAGFSAGLAVTALAFVNLNSQSRANVQKGESDHSLDNEGPENKALANVRPTSNLPAPTDDSDINPVAFLC